MLGVRYDRFLKIFLMLVLVGAGISPACKFISGQKNFLEICGAQSSKTVALSGDFSPFPDDKEETDKHAKNDCAFCFASGHVKVVQPTPLILFIPSKPAVQTLRDFDEPVFTSGTTDNFSARAPPMLLSA